jgi:hypothetical protein
MFKTILVAAISFASISAAYAEAITNGPTLIAPTGKVLVNHGQGFVQAADGQTLKFQDRIMVGKGAAVTLAYAKCSLVLKEGTLLSLPKGDLCGKDSTAALQNSEAIQIAPVAITGVGGGAGCTAACGVGLGFMAGIGAIGAYETVSKP